MSIYIITNRSVSGSRINDVDERARPTFRVAKCNVDKENKKVNYSLIPDSYAPGYQEIVNATKSGQDTQLQGTARMFFDLYNNMISSKEESSDTLFFIHGFNYTFKSTLEHIYELYELYIKPKDSPIEHLVYVSWPTVGNLFLTYWNDQEDAEETGRVLSRLFSKLFGFYIDAFEKGGLERCKHKIHLAAHSMGNQVLKHMLVGIPETKLFPLFKEVLLLNADVEYDVFEPGKSFSKLGEVSERVHLYIHNSDDALRISRSTKNFKQRLGFKGPKERDILDSSTFIMDTTYGEKPRNKKEKWIDHWGYLNRPDVVEDVKYVLSGMDEDDVPIRKKWDESSLYFYFPKKD